jgi:hypothetical protein
VAAVDGTLVRFAPGFSLFDMRTVEGLSRIGNFTALTAE